MAPLAPERIPGHARAHHVRLALLVLQTRKTQRKKKKEKKNGVQPAKERQRKAKKFIIEKKPAETTKPTQECLHGDPFSIVLIPKCYPSSSFLSFLFSFFLFLYQRDDKGVPEAQAGGNGQNRVQALQNGPEQNHLANARGHRQRCQMHAEQGGKGAGVG